jgi:hypothetical protein
MQILNKICFFLQLFGKNIRLISMYIYVLCKLSSGDGYAATTEPPAS